MTSLHWRPFSHAAPAPWHTDRILCWRLLSTRTSAPPNRGHFESHLPLPPTLHAFCKHRLAPCLNSYSPLSGKQLDRGRTDSPDRSLRPRPCDLRLRAPPTRSQPLGEQPVQLSDPQGGSRRSEVTFRRALTDNLCQTSPVTTYKMQRERTGASEKHTLEMYNVLGDMLCWCLPRKTRASPSPGIQSADRISKHIIPGARLLIVMMAVTLRRSLRVHRAPRAARRRRGSVRRPDRFPTAHRLLQSAPKHSQEAASTGWEEQVVRLIAALCFSSWRRPAAEIIMAF